MTMGGNTTNSATDLPVEESQGVYTLLADHMGAIDALIGAYTSPSIWCRAVDSCNLFLTDLYLSLNPCMHGVRRAWSILPSLILLLAYYISPLHIISFIAETRAMNTPHHPWKQPMPHEHAHDLFHPRYYLHFVEESTLYT